MNKKQNLDPRNHKIDKGDNVLFVAQLAHKLSEASVKQRNQGIRDCEGGKSCVFGAGKSSKSFRIQQAHSNQQVYNVDGTPRGNVQINRRGSERAADYHAGRSVGNERSQRLYRASTDMRVCNRYRCENIIFNVDGTINDLIAKKELSPAIYNTNKTRFRTAPAPSWVGGENETLMINGEQIERSGVGYDK